MFSDNPVGERQGPMAVPDGHFVHQRAIQAPFPEGVEVMYLGMGCFWGAERLLWQQAGVWTTAVGYSGGNATDPTYEQVRTGKTGHTEVVLVAYNPLKITCQALLETFWENHDPTQGMRQGNDRGTQYRSAIYTTTDDQLLLACKTKKHYQTQLFNEGGKTITTEIAPVNGFYYAEAYHQQYLAKNPQGYCGIGGTGVCFSPT